MDVRHWARAARSFIRHLRSPEFVRQVASAGLQREMAPQAVSAYVLDAYPEAEGVAVDVGTVTYRRSNLDPMEQYVLGVLARLYNPRIVFEIGTFDGASTLLLARNAPDAQVMTLDLDPGSADRATVDAEAGNAQMGVGARFVDEPEATRITQLFGDSRSFDFSPWFGTVDLVLVDGGHERECAKADTATALRLLARGGIAVWDDYQIGWPEVVRSVDEARLPGLLRLESTDFAVYHAP